jgi:hypothetical protein
MPSTWPSRPRRRSSTKNHDAASLLRRLSRAFRLCAPALAIAFVAATPGTAAAMDPQTLPPQGVYEQCGPAISGEAACLSRLDQIRAAGFDAVLNYTLWYASADQVKRYIDHAQAIGMKVIIPLNYKAWRDGVTSLKQTYGYLAPSCGCSDNAGFTSYAIGLVKDRPGTWGYYIGDENDADSSGMVRALGDRVKALDPARPHLYIAFANQAQSTSNLAPYASAADLVGVDYYPIGTPDTPSGLSSIAAGAQGLADNAGKQSAVVLQAFSWDQYPHSGDTAPRWPTVDEMRKMRDVAIANSDPNLILWYSYNDVMRSDDPAGHLADLRNAAFAPIATPDTSIVAGPEGTVSSSDASFTSSSDLGSSFECQLDGGAWQPCGAQQSYSGLSAGDHQFAVRALDRRGRTDQSPATRVWTAAPPAPPAPPVTTNPVPPGDGFGVPISQVRFALAAIHVSSSGMTRVVVHVPGPGKVIAVGRVVTRRAARSAGVTRAKRAATRTLSAGSVSLALRIRPHKGSASSRKRKLKIVVTFDSASGGKRLTRTKSIVLKR